MQMHALFFFCHCYANFQPVSSKLGKTLPLIPQKFSLTLSIPRVINFNSLFQSLTRDT